MKHNDCKYFNPIDVFKGICRKTGTAVFIDTPPCPAFLEAQKCRNCSHFTNPNSEEIGTCTGLTKEFWAYGDMNAKTCEGYQNSRRDI